MNYEFLSRLYCDCSDGSSSFAEMYDRLDEVGTAEAALSERMKDYPMSEQDEVGYLEAAVCTAYEKQGFINGFRLGLLMSRELKEISV